MTTSQELEKQKQKFLDSAPYRKNRESFLELTSDHAIRKAAYPDDEYVSNGGKIGAGFMLSDPIAFQDEPPEIIPTGGGLLGLLGRGNQLEPVKQDPARRAANIAQHWQKVESHDYYKWLMSDVNFKKAWRKFQNKKDKKVDGNLISAIQQFKPINSEFVDFRFLRLVALQIGYQLFCDDIGFKPTYADSKTLDKAKGYITKLQATFAKGVALSNYVHHDQLERHLEQLLLEIKRAPHKEKATQTAEKRKCLEAFALSFMHEFGSVSATILTDLSAMLGWSCDDTTIDRIVRATKRKHVQQLAKALKEHTAQNSQK